MQGTVFICNREWKILSFMNCSEKLSLHEGDILIEIAEEGKELLQDAGNSRVLLLTFPAMQQSFTAQIRIFPEGILVVLSHVTCDEDFIEAFRLYEQGIKWAENRFHDIFHDEYFMIQQLNNQLIDSKRALARTNSRLKHTLRKMEETNQELDKAKLMAEKAMQIAQNASQSKSAFLANMSHDIRTPMNAIVGLANLMEYEIQDPEKMQTYIEKLQTTSQHLLGMLNDILDISKIESGTISLRMESVNLKQQMEQIAAVIRPQAHERKQLLEITGSDIRHENFIGDAVRIRQIVLNLLSNAVKYTPEGGHIRFHMEELEEGAADLATYRFTITDNGIGMSEDYLKHLFEPFSRSEESQKSGTQGTGLGMAIVKNLIELMKGTIDVESTPGNGTTFKVLLPFQLDMDPTMEKAVSRKKSAIFISDGGQSEKAGHGTVESVLRGMHILCAEDNTLNAEILESLLELAGAKCHICSDGKQLAETFEHAAAGTYDVILTDIQMPVMNGYEAVLEIRKSHHPEAGTVPIIAMTANVFAEDIQKCLDVGMNAHVGKPIDIEILENTVCKVVAQKKTSV